MNPADRAAALFRAAFGERPSALATAAGRVNLIGEHVDYHGGHVLPVATAERTAVAVGRAPHRFRAVSEHGAAEDAPWPPAPGGGWSDYVGGVAALMAAGSDSTSGVAVAVASDLALGAGQSSSAALEVAAAAALAAWWGRSTEPRTLAAIAHRAETEFVGVPCGVMDQLASAAAPPGCALLLDCRTLETRAVRVGVDLVLADSGESRALRRSAYAERRREGDEARARLRAAWPALESLVEIPPARLSALLQSLPSPLDRRVRHVVSENLRALLAARALEEGDYAAFGSLVNASHKSLRDLYECSTPRLDAIVEAARGVPRVLGARLVGAGWGGAVLVIAEPGAGGTVAMHLSADRELDLAGARVVRPGGGVEVLT